MYLTYAIGGLLMTLALASVHAQDCSTFDAKERAFLKLIWEPYPLAVTWIYPNHRDPELMEVYLYPTEPPRDCEGVIRVDDDCRITDPDGTPLDNQASLERAFRCTPSP